LHHGVDAYNKAMEDHFAKVVETVNGHANRLVHSMRFGALYMVDGRNRGHQTESLKARATRGVFFLRGLVPAAVELSVTSRV
jgi:hypothetical protein